MERNEGNIWKLAPFRKSFMNIAYLTNDTPQSAAIS